jgi:protein phosphatase
VLAAIAQAPAWLRRGRDFFVHGGFHSCMLYQPAPLFGDKVEGPLARALFGQTTGRRQPDGYPERLLDWVDRIPAGLTVYCGHDIRSTDGRPLTIRGAGGGRAVFLDTGAGKGGHLSWIDLPGEE